MNLADAWDSFKKRDFSMQYLLPEKHPRTKHRQTAMTRITSIIRESSTIRFKVLFVIFASSSLRCRELAHCFLFSPPSDWAAFAFTTVSTARKSAEKLRSGFLA